MYAIYSPFQFSNLSAIERSVAEHIGITEVCLIQFVKHGKVTVRVVVYLHTYNACTICIDTLNLSLFHQIVSHATWSRFILSLIIYKLWNRSNIWDVSKEFNISRGSIHSFLMRTATFASCVQRFTEVRIRKVHDV